MFSKLLPWCNTVFLGTVCRNRSIIQQRSCSPRRQWKSRRRDLKQSANSSKPSRIHTISLVSWRFYLISKYRQVKFETILLRQLWLFMCRSDWTIVKALLGEKRYKYQSKRWIHRVLVPPIHLHLQSLPNVVTSRRNRSWIISSISSTGRDPNTHGEMHAYRFRIHKPDLFRCHAKYDTELH